MDGRIGHFISTGYLLACAMALCSCVSYPTLVETARESNGQPRDSLTVDYKITDKVVLNYTDSVKRLLASKCDRASLARYGSAATQTTLSTLAGAASTAGWATSTASGLGLGATYIFGLGNIIDAKGHSQAYEQALTAVQAAEANFYFYQLHMGFKPVNGKMAVDTSDVPHVDENEIPSDSKLTPDGETLYYRVTKIVKVLDDVLSGKIPNLEDLKDASGENSGKAPLKPNDAPPSSAGGSGNGMRRTSSSNTDSTSDTGGEKKIGETGGTGDGSKTNAELPPPHNKSVPDSPEVQAAKEDALNKVNDSSDPDAQAALESITGDPTPVKRPKVKLQQKISDAKTVDQVQAISGKVMITGS